ncbi:MAG: hypothetical protein CEO12_387 [Parcubacteria group bacterium Gr01-1014_46]|nr:MAG: hypothetical protein CEO12_387 [Parcubacteria group bacterium Gr01-1014_46]
MDYTQSFLRVANTYPEFREALEIIKKNSKGKAWLIGGFVCRSIIQDLYGVPMSKDVDLDFIIEKPQDIVVPDGWKIEKNSYGNPKLIGQSFEIDYVPLNNIHFIIRHNLEPSIENFLLGTPLNVQSIAFDIITNKVIGDIGLKSIQEKIVAINDMEQARHRAEKKGVVPDDLVKDIANQFGFKTIL